MKIKVRHLFQGLACVFLLAFAFGALAQKTNAPAPERDQKLQTIVDEAAQATLKKFVDKGLQQQQIAITLIDVTDKSKPLFGHFRGEAGIYPASVVKLFYLVATHQWL